MIARLRGRILPRDHDAENIINIIEAIYVLSMVRDIGCAGSHHGAQPATRFDHDRVLRRCADNSCFILYRLRHNVCARVAQVTTRHPLLRTWH